MYYSNLWHGKFEYNMLNEILLDRSSQSPYTFIDYFYNLEYHKTRVTVLSAYIHMSNIPN